MVDKICTHCGYEGKAIRPPSDAGGEDESFLVGFVNKLIFVTTFMPIKINGVVRLLSRGKAKHCPNCGLPLMVSLSSDAGWLAKRKMDIKAGLKFGADAPPPVAFGSKIMLPGDEKPAPVEEVVPTALPPLHVLLEEKEEPLAAPIEVKQEVEQPKPKKNINPEEW